MKKKLLLSFSIVFILFMVILQPISFGYNLTYKAKTSLNSGGNVEDYVYRTYTTAHPQTIKNFPSYSPKYPVPDLYLNPDPNWSYSWGGAPLLATQLRSRNMRFHTQLIGNYTSGGTYGYTTGLVTDPSVLQNTSVNRAFTNLGYGNSNVGEVLSTSDSQFKRMMLLTIVNGSYKPYISPGNPVGASSLKIYVTDHYITSSQLNSLKGNIGSDNGIYVSNVVETLYGRNSNGALAGPYIAGAVERTDYISTLFS